PTTARAESALTHARSIMGSPLYMAPEQMRATRNADPRSDIWALGMILCEMISGHAPFEGATIPEICVRILHDTPTMPEGLPDGLLFVLLRCLAKDPAERYQTVAELAVALVPFGPERSRFSAERVHGLLASRAGTTSGVHEAPPISAESSALAKSAVTQDA